MKGTARITDSLEVRDTSGSFDCNVFETIRDRLPTSYICKTVDNSAFSKVLPPITLYTAVWVIISWFL